MTITRRQLTTAAGALLAAGATSACVPGTSSSTANSAPPKPTTTDVAKLGKVTLREIDFFSTGDEGSWWKDVIAGFQAKNPNITITRSTASFDDTMKTLNLKMSGNDAPDVVPANNGWQSLGTLVQGGLVLNLDTYATTYGWDRRLPASIRRQTAFSTDGKSMGVGSLFAMPVARSTLIGVYYNRALLKRLGVPVPTTFAAFESALAAAKKAGLTPLELGILEQWPVTAPLFAVQDAIGKKAAISDFTYSQATVALAETGLLEAAQTMKRWTDAGYFTKDFSGISSTAAGTAFSKGTGVFRFDYTGSLPLTAAQRPGYGFFILPRKDGGPIVATGATATPYAVSSKSKHPEAAAAFLDFVSSQATADLAVKHGLLPLLTTKPPTSIRDVLSADEIKAQRTLDASDDYVPFFDWSTPTFLDTVAKLTQEVLAGKTTPASLVAGGQANYTAWAKQRAA